VLLISDGPVSFCQGGNKSDSYKILSLLRLENLFLPQFIPLVHYLLFLRMYNCDDYLAQNMNYVDPMDTDPILSIFMGFKSSALVSHRNQFRMQMS